MTAAKSNKKTATKPSAPSLEKTNDEKSSASTEASKDSKVLDPKEPEVFADSQQGLVKVEDTALAAYGEREVVRELVSRLMKFHPAASEVGMPGMIMAAQLAILMGASPIPGTNEIHVWKDNRGNIIVSPGINYWERRARQQGGIFWDIEPRPMNEEERRQYAIPPSDLAAICRGVRLADLMGWIDKGLPPEAALKGFGRIGLGLVGTRTYTWNDATDYKERKMGRPLIWTAIKRARTDCLKNLYPVIPGERVDGGPGMEVGDDGAYRPIYDSHWVALDAKIIEEETSPGEMSDDERSDFLWGASRGVGDAGAFLAQKANEQRSSEDEAIESAEKELESEGSDA